MTPKTPQATAVEVVTTMPPSVTDKSASVIISNFSDSFFIFQIFHPVFSYLSTPFYIILANPIATPDKSPTIPEVDIIIAANSFEKFIDFSILF